MTSRSKVQQKSLLQSSLMVIAARILSAIGSFILFWLISQENVAQLGLFRTIFVFFLVCDFLPLLGMNQYIIREIALRSHQGREIFSCSLFFTSLTCLVIIASLACTALYGRYSSGVASGLFIVALSIPATSIVLCCQSVLIGSGDGATFGQLQGGETLLRTLIGGGLFLFTSDILTICYCFTIIRWLSLVPYIKRTRPLLAEGRWGLKPSHLKEFFSHVPSFATILILFLLLRFGPQLMVPWMSGDQAAGYFALIFQFLDLLLLVPTALAVNLMPLLASRAHESPGELAATSAHTLRLMTFLLLPAVLFLAIEARPVILLVFGPEYEPAAQLVTITIATGLLMAWDQVFSTGMVAAKKQSTDLLTLTVASLSMLLLLYTLIGWYGVLGGAIAFMAGSVILILTRYTLFSITIAPLKLFGALWRYLFASAFMAFGLIIFEQDLLFSALTALGLYCGGLLMAGGLSRHEMQTLLCILKGPQHPGKSLI